jgi:fatty-acyl-CoA synthase
MINRASHVPLSPLTFIARARRGFATKSAVYEDDGTQVNYAQLGDECDALAGALRSSGVRPGDRVAVQDYNSSWLLAARFGVPGLAGPLVALSTRLAAAKYAHILAHAQAKVLLVSSALRC